MNKIMILKGNSPAIHLLGDIRREEDEYIRIHEETETHYIGNFEEGFGFINVEFRKEDCRQLTEEERKELNGKWYSISGNPLYRIYVDEQGNIVNGKCVMKKGIINKITNAEGEDKHSDWIGINVEFSEDIDIGRSLIMIIDDGRYITTSKVINVEIVDGDYVIYTKNSVYFINVKGDK